MRGFHEICLFRKQTGVCELGYELAPPKTQDMGGACVYYTLPSLDNLSVQI